MTLVDNRVRDLRAGYFEVSQGEIRIRSEWRARLLAAYKHQRQEYDSARKSYQQRRARNKKFILFGLVSVAGLGIVSTLLLLAWTMLGGETARLWQFLLVCGFPVMCLFAIGIAAFAWWGFYRLPAPEKPQHPMKSGLLKLLPLWWDGLRRELPRKAEDDGAIGEHIFVRRVEKILSADHFVTLRMHQRPGEDVDVIVIGPKGVWVFEVKYWSGSIIWQNGRWQREKSYYETGGKLVTESKPISQPPDSQWLRAKDDVTRTLHIRVRETAAHFLNNRGVEGGIALTHPGASYQIAPGCPVTVGNTQYWMNQLADAPVIPGWNRHTTLGVLDGLLERHHQISAGETRSMVSRAEWVIQHTEANLAKWVDSQLY